MIPMPILKSEKPAEKIAEKKPIRRVDPIIDKYREEGLFGVRPGKIKRNGKELTVEEAKDAERKEKEDLERIAREEALQVQRAKEMELSKRAADILSNARNSITSDYNEGRKEARVFLRDISIINSVSAALFTTAHFMSHWSWGFVGILGVLTVVGTLGYMKEMVFGTADDRQDRYKIENARNSISNIYSSKAALEVLGAYEKGEEISDEKLRTALDLDHKLLKELFGLETDSKLVRCMKELAETTGNEKALALHNRIKKILME